MTSTIKTAKRATQMYFLLCGLAISAWAPMVPFVKEGLKLNDSSLGLLLLFLGAGAICTMPFVGWLINRVGSKLVMVTAAIIFTSALPVLALLNTWVEMAAMLFIFGAALGALDVAMNAHGSIIQNISEKPIMSSLHGLFSVGGLLGPLLMAALVKAGLSVANSAIIMSAGLLIIILSYQSSLLKQQDENGIADHKSHRGDQPSGLRTAWLNPTVLFLGAMCFIVFLSEGAMLDWGALLLHDNRGMDKALSGLGYAFFSVAMAIMRLFGDKIVSKFSSQSVVLTGSIIAFVGYCCILFVAWIPATLLGFALIGIGAANIVPVFFSAAGSMKNVSGASAISIMGTIGYVGQLAGPAILGFLAQHLSLPIALFISGLLFLIAGISYRVSGIKTQ